MKFVKMQGCGNDYVYVDCRTEQVEDASSLAVKISDRHFGVGGDGLILIKASQEYHGEMVMYNADGSQSEMCGNGLRCVAKYLHDYYYQGYNELIISTGRGPLKAEIQRDSDQKAEWITLDMGAPIFEGKEIPTTLIQPKVFNEKIIVEGREFTFSSLSMGNPHCVIFVDDLKNFPIQKWGPLIENHEYFPNRVNVEFVEMLGENELLQRTWERGSGETLACGTGASAVAVVAMLSGKASSKQKINLLGGTLFLEYNGEGAVKLTGPAVEVFHGEW